MRDKYKYLALVVGRSWWRAFVDDLSTIRTPQLHAIANAFAANIGRAMVLGSTYSEIAYQARRNQWCMDYALQSAGLVIPPPLTSFNPSAEVIHEYRRQLLAFNSLSDGERSTLMAHWGAAFVGDVMVKFTPGMDRSMEALLSSTLIQSWMAFEVLASDLWARAIDRGPAHLRKRVARKALRAEKSDDPMDLLSDEDLEYDPQKRLGSYLLQARKVSFGRLVFIKSNYETAFSDKIKSVFKSDRHIDALSAFRNALIHAGGKADAHFKKQIKGFAEFDKIKKNRKLALDGKLVARLRAAATTVGAGLLHYVDDVMTPP